MQRSAAPPRDFGSLAPRGLVAVLVGAARRCPGGWFGKRVAFTLRWIGVRALGRRALDVETFGCRMRLYPGHNVAEKNLLFTPQYFDPGERAILAAALGPSCTFVDVGANVGGYALFVAERAGAGARVLAIEPHPDLYERLSFNIAQNPFANVKALSCALADREGLVTLFTDPGNKGETSMRTMSSDGLGGHVKVPAKALAPVLAAEGFATLDALKLDVEGAEDLVLEPFFRDADPALWPRVLIVEDSPARWSIDLPALILESGYTLALRTRTNVVYRRA